MGLLQSHVGEKPVGEVPGAKLPRMGKVMVGEVPGDRREAASSEGGAG